jgi:hypothetical protein
MESSGRCAGKDESKLMIEKLLERSTCLQNYIVTMLLEFMVPQNRYGQ